MAAGIASMHVSQSQNQRFPTFSSQPNYNSYGSEKTFSTQNKSRQLKFENRQNTERELYPYPGGRTRRANKRQNRGNFSKNRSFYNRNKKNCLTTTEKDPQRHSEHSVRHAPAISTLPEIVLSDNQHTKIEICLSTNSQKTKQLACLSTKPR